MTALIVAGVDLSLTSTGIARISWGFPGAPRDTIITTRTITSTGRAGATLADRQERLHRIAEQVCEETGGADLAVIEGPSFGQARQGGQHDRAGLWWLVVDILTEEYGVTVAEVPPAARAKYAAGKGNAAKDAVLAAVIRRYPAADVTGNDTADALVLAAMGARHLGHPVEVFLPLTHLTAVDKIRWPERTSEQ